MTRDESLDITAMVMSSWPQSREWGRDEIDAFARGIEDLAAEVTIHTVRKLSKEVAHRPRISELRERVRSEVRAMRPVVAPPDETVLKELEPWVKRWICARMLYPRFGKERDLRRFPQQQDHGDLTQELMPEGVWEQEAATLDDEGFRLAFRQFVKGES